jgi:hypothetical protein
MQPAGYSGVTDRELHATGCKCMASDADALAKANRPRLRRDYCQISLQIHRTPIGETPRGREA